MHVLLPLVHVSATVSTVTGEHVVVRCHAGQAVSLHERRLVFVFSSSPSFSISGTTWTRHDEALFELYMVYFCRVMRVADRSYAYIFMMRLSLQAILNTRYVRSSCNTCGAYNCVIAPLTTRSFDFTLKYRCLQCFR